MGKTLQAAFRSGWGETLILNTWSSSPPLCGHTNMQPAKGGTWRSGDPAFARRHEPVDALGNPSASSWPQAKSPIFAGQRSAAWQGLRLTSLSRLHLRRARSRSVI